MAFKPKIHACVIEDDGEQVTIFVKEPAGDEVLAAAEKAAARRAKNEPDPTPRENARESFSRFVCHEDGTELSKDEVEEMLKWRFSAMSKASDAVLAKTGLGKAAAEAAKKA